MLWLACGGNYFGVFCTVHEGLHVKRICEMPGIKQKALITESAKSQVLIRAVVCNL